MNFIEDLTYKLQQPLPGWNAHEKMAPKGRERQLIPSPDAKLSGVMILLFDIDKKWNTLLIRRTQDGQVHSGQIGFPGGKKENFDTDLIATALRECEEEINVKKKDITVLGSLSPIYIPPSNFLVTPTVGYVSSLQQYKAAEREVQEIIQVPLEVLFYPNNKQVKNIQRNQDDIIWEAPVYSLSDDIDIWGATAMMISELETLILPS